MADSSAPPGWTDHNIHDPGITLLQVLVYTLGAVAVDDGQIVGSAARVRHW